MPVLNYTLHIFIVLISGMTGQSFAQSDTIIKWGADLRLTYGDFSGQRATPEVSHDNFDTIALIRCSFKYSFSIKDGKRVIQAYAFMDPKKSWMDEKNLDVLCHEQDISTSPKFLPEGSRKQSMIQVSLIFGIILLMSNRNSRKPWKLFMMSK